MKNIRPIRRAQREQRKAERQRVNKRCCPFCIEMDHTAGRHHDSRLKSEVCPKHHDVLTDLRLDAEISMCYEPDSVKRVALALRSVSVYHHMLGDAEWRWADLLDGGSSNGASKSLPTSSRKRSPKA